MLFSGGLMNSFFDVVFGIANAFHLAVGIIFDIIFG